MYIYICVYEHTSVYLDLFSNDMSGLFVRMAGEIAEPLKDDQEIARVNRTGLSVWDSGLGFGVRV